MKYGDIQEAIKEAERFIDRAQETIVRIEKDRNDYCRRFPHSEPRS